MLTSQDVVCWQEMEGYSGSDVRLVCKEAAMRSVRKIFAALETQDKGLSTSVLVQAVHLLLHVVSPIQEALRREPSSWSP